MLDAAQENCIPFLVLLIAIDFKNPGSQLLLIGAGPEDAENNGSQDNEASKVEHTSPI